MILRSQLEPVSFLIAFLVIVFGLVLHNIVQTLVAASQGDETPRNYGFASTDPRIHIEPLYLIFLLIFGFAFPRSIPLNSRNVRGRGGPEAIVWLSGPLGLIAWAFVVLIAARLLAIYAPSDTDMIQRGLTDAVEYLIMFSVFYLVPVPPLDGARALLAVGSFETRRFIRQLESYGPVGFLLIFILLSYTGILGRIAAIIGGFLASLLALLGL